MAPALSRGAHYQVHARMRQMLLLWLRLGTW